jgi:hypothetical protein
MTNESYKTNPVKTTKLRRRWFRFRLRTLLGLVTLLSVPLGWVGWELDRHRRLNEHTNHQPNNHQENTNRTFAVAIIAQVFTQRE